MTQNQLNREIAEATGETVEFVKKFGFHVVNVPPRHLKPRPGAGTNRVRPVRQPKPVCCQNHPLRAAA